MNRLLPRLSVALFVAAFIVQGYTPIEPDQIGVDLKDVRIPGLRQKETATAMAEYAASLGAKPKHAVLQSRLIALSLLFDQTNRTALLTNAKLKKGLSVTSRTSPNKAQVTKKLMALAQAVGKQKSLDAKRLAATLYSLVASIDPSNEDALLQEELLSQKDIKANWPKPGAAPTGSVVRQGFEKGLATGFGNKRKQFVKSQASIAAMMVVDAGPTGYVGKPLDAILNIRSNRKARGENPIPKFKRTVGKEMTTSLDEAVRAVRIRYPKWQNNVNMTVSFSDKYAPKDGGSAGMAYCILMLSCLDGIQLDSEFAVTGDITVDWAVRRIGGAAEKIRGARVAGYKYALIPAENERDVADIPLLYSTSDLWRIQIFSAETLGDAVDLVRADRDGQLKKAMDDFARVQAYLKKRGTRGLPQTKKILRKILSIAPNHLSAKYLLRIAEGKPTRYLSLSTSLSNIMLAVHPLLPHIIGEKNSVNHILTKVPDGALEASKKRLDMLSRRVHPKARELTEALIDYRSSIERIRKSIRELSQSKRSSGTMKDFVFKQAQNADEKRNKVIEILNKVNKDREVQEELRK